MSPVEEVVGALVGSSSVGGLEPGPFAVGSIVSTEEEGAMVGAGSEVCTEHKPQALGHVTAIYPLLKYNGEVKFDSRLQACYGTCYFDLQVPVTFGWLSI